MNKKYIIDCSNLQVGGGIQVAISFINDLLIINNKNHYYIFLSPQMKNSFERNLFLDYFTFIDIDSSYYSNIFRRGIYLKKMENNIKPDAIFTVFGPSYHKSNFFKIVGFAIPHLIYQDSPYFKNLSIEESIKNKLIMYIKQFFFIKNSDSLIFETKDSKNIFIKKSNFIKPTYVVNNTLNQIFNDPQKWKDFYFQNEQDTTYILCLSANYPHKNLNIIPKIIDELINIEPKFKFQFLLTINENDLNIDNCHKRYMSFLGKVDINMIPSLYQKNDIVIVPSLLEVFSTTYLEAMYMKKPIICSDMSFARDICANSAIYCSPLNPFDYAKAILKIQNDVEFKNSLISKGIDNLNRFDNSLVRTQAYLNILNKNYNA